MKAIIKEIETGNFYDFCYRHGGVRIDDSWFDENKKISRFLTADRKHRSYDTYTYVYIEKPFAPCDYATLITSPRENRNANAVLCIDEEGDECYIFCIEPSIGKEVEFDKIGFHPYTSNPEPNRYGRWREDD